MNLLKTVNKWKINHIMLFNKKCLLNQMLVKDSIQQVIIMKTSVKSLYIKLLKPSNSFWDPSLTLPHIFVFGPCHLLTDNSRKFSSKRQLVEVLKVLMQLLLSLVCSYGSTLLWVLSWVWILWNVSYTPYVFNGLSSKTNFSKQMDGNSLL